MQVFFVRHGQTDGNLARRHQHPETPLNDEGKRQVEAVAKRIKALKPTHLITSTQLRALESTRIIVEACDLVPETVPAFEELSRPRSLVGERYVGLATFWYAWRWFRGLDLPGGESYAELRQRISDGKAHLESLPKGSRVVVVSHAVFLSLFIAHICRSEPLSFIGAVRTFLNIFKVRNAALIELRYDPIKNGCGWTILRH